MRDQLRFWGLILVAVGLALGPLRVGYAGTIQVLPPVTDADGRLGLCDILAGPVPNNPNLTWAQLAYNAGARYNRWEFRWDKIEPKAGTWNFADTDADVQSSLAAGINVLGILDGTPGWGAAPGQPPGNGVPRGLNLDPNDPNNLWAAFVRQTVSQYQGQVKAWEVWNEPDLKFFWNSTPDDYYRLLKVTYMVVKSVDPNAKVLMAGMVVPGLVFAARVLDDANRDPSSVSNGGYFDIASWHAYGSAHSAYDNIRQFEALLRQKERPDAPVWVTEDGFPASNPNGEARQAAYVLQTAAFALAAGARKVFVYRASDDPTPKTWGLVTATGAPRQGYVAFQVAAQFLSNATAVSYAPTKTLERFVFYGPERRVVLAWSRSSNPVDFNVDATQLSAVSVDWMGATRTVNAPNGQYHLTASGAQYNAGVDNTNSVVGGPPQLLVETAPAVQITTPASYLPPLPGQSRRVVLFNPAGTQVAVQVQAVGYPADRLVIPLPPRGLRKLDLDLLAGSTYQGLYSIASTGAIVAQGVSNQVQAVPLTPGTAWTMPIAPHAVTIANTGLKGQSLAVTAIGDHGRVRLHAVLQVGANSRLNWSMPSALATMHLALSLTSSGPLVVGSATQGLQSHSAQSTWYALRPVGKLSVFNPDPSAVAQIDVRYLHSKTLQNVQARIRPRHSYTLPSAHAGAVVISASRPVAAGYIAPAKPPVPPVSASTTLTSLAAAGNITHVAVFNPGLQTVHVTVSAAEGKNVQQRSIDLAPRVTHVLSVRAPNDPAAAVTVKGDAPVVVAPSR